MMTFLIVPGNFNLNAFLLDRQRLQKQRVEAATIINILSNPENIKSNAWSNHTIVRSWKYFIYNKNGFIDDKYLVYSIKSIKYYMNCVVKQYIRRNIGKNNYEFWKINCNKCDNLKNLNCDNKYKILKCDNCGKSFKLYLPWWVNWSPFIQSNIAMLIRKKPSYYNKIAKKLKFNNNYLKKGYIWPCNVLDKDNYKIHFSPILKELVNPVYCNAIISSGKRKGKICENIVRKNGMKKCNVHKKMECS